MNRITITMTIPDEIADPFHEMGVTDDGHMEIMDALMGIGDDIEIKREDEQ